VIGGLDKVGEGRGREWGNCVLRADCVRWIGLSGEGDWEGRGRVWWNFLLRADGVSWIG